MHQLFADQSFSDFMNARLAQMKAEIDKLKCADVETLNEAALRARAEKFAEKYLVNDIPRVDRTALEKSSDESSGKKYWELPFTGSENYFKYSPSEQPRGNYVDKIANQRLFIQLEENASMPAGEAELRAESTLSAIEKALARMQEDVDTQFSPEKIRETAEQILKRKRDSCAKLRAGGYSVR